jgi:hypothetical protein
VVPLVDSAVVSPVVATVVSPSVVPVLVDVDGSTAPVVLVLVESSPVDVGAIVVVGVAVVDVSGIGMVIMLGPVELPPESSSDGRVWWHAARPSRANQGRLRIR